MPKPNVHIRKGNGFHYAVPTSGDQSKTIMRGTQYGALRKKLIKAGHAIIPESAEDFLAEVDTTSKKPRFEQTWCSQCGKEFGPGDHGFSACRSHRNLTLNKLRKERKASAPKVEEDWTTPNSERNDDPEPVQRPHLPHGERTLPPPDRPALPASPRASSLTFADLAIGDTFRWASNRGGDDVLRKEGEDLTYNVTVAGLGLPYPVQAKSLHQTGRSALDHVRPLGKSKVTPMPETLSAKEMVDLLLSEGDCTYHAFYKGKKIELTAATSLAARDAAAKRFGAKKAYDVSVVLVGRSDGSEVVHKGEIPG